MAVQRAPRKPPGKGLWAALGPGLVTGASDDDPSGIATYSQAGAQFGLSMCWVMLFTFPLMAAIQEISARIGRVTGQGIAGNIRAHYSPLLLRAIVGLLLIANIINLGADLGAMGDAVTLLIGGPAKLYVVLFAIGCAALETFSRYERYVVLLKWSSVFLLAYVATALVVDTPWALVARDTFLPTFRMNTDYVVAIVAVLGTTITPYCFFWQSSQEAEDERIDPLAHALLDAPEQARAQIGRIRLDTYVGMGYSNLISLFIIITTAATLNAHGITDIQTSSQAAEALRPIAGAFTFALFAAGIIGIGLLAIPVLAGSCAYALGEALAWPTGLDRLPLDARAFYGTIVVSTLIGVMINFIGLDPVKALFWAAVINGVVAVPLMVVMMIMAMAPKVMGQFILPPALCVMGWLCTAVMAIAVGIMFATW
ncbi:MAG TPA: divalent metal cation transporter [Rhodopila sp.]|nr:divalent metal cation transporter [Rhodopila sp.]